MSYTASLYYNKQRIKQNGTATIYIQVIIDRERTLINLDFEWPVQKIDTNSNILLPRKKQDVEHSDYMLIVGNELAKINEIFRLARLSDKQIGIKEFKEEFLHFDSRDNFISFWEKTLENRINKGIIRKTTAANHLSSLNTLKEFVNELPFYEITKAFLENYKAFLFNKKKYDSDSAHTKLKNFRTYLNQAKEAKYKFDYPFTNFKMPKEQRRIEYLNEDEFQSLKKYYYSNHLTPGTNKEKALQVFLFLCYTGIRLGDIHLLTHSNILNGVLFFQPSKNPKELQKTVEIPLHNEAKKLIKTKKGRLFDMPSSDTKMREMLREIATKLGINSSCSPHVARHTFATRFLRKGGRLEVLKELLGHENINTTMIYVHVDLERKRNEINFL